MTHLLSLGFIHNFIYTHTPNVSFTIVGKNLTRQALSELQKDLDKTAAGFEDVRVEAGKAGKKGEDALDGMGDSARRTKADFGALAISAGALSASIGLAVKGVLSASIQMDSMKRGLLAAAGSTAAMEAQLKRLYEVAKLPGLGLPEAVQASIRLQAVKFDAEFAERSLKAIGNALASVGAGRAELDGVALAMTQMKAKGKVLAEEINQIAERMPQVRQAMIDAFGTANTEMIQDMGLTVDEFLEGLISQLETLPSVSGGASNSMENLSDSIFQLKVQFGDILLPTLVKVVDKLSDVVDWISKLSATQKEILVWGTVGIGAVSGLVAALAGFGMALPGIIRSVQALSTAVSWLITNPYGLAILGGSLLAGVILKMTIFRDNTLDAADAVGTLTSALSKQNEELVRTTLIQADQSIAKTRKEIEGLTEEMGKLLNEVLKRRKGGFGGFLGMTDEALQEAYQKIRARRAQLIAELEELQKSVTKAEQFLSGKKTETSGRAAVSTPSGRPATRVTSPFILHAEGDEEIIRSRFEYLKKTEEEWQEALQKSYEWYINLRKLQAEENKKRTEEIGQAWAKILGNFYAARDEWKDIIKGISYSIAGIPTEIARGIKEGESLLNSFFNSIQSTISSILSSIANEFQKIAASKITAKIMGDTSIYGEGSGASETLGSFILNAASLALMSFDNPRNDRMARNAGLIQGLHFANPVNDYQARVQGLMTASKELGERSADDMVTHFRSGFEQRTKEKGGGNTDEILSRIETALSANSAPRFQLIIDGRELEATVQRLTDKREFRQAGY